MRVSRFAALCVLFPAAAVAQLAQNTGAVNGTVSDSSGGAVPAAKVTATSPALQGQLTFLTNEQGNYRFPSLPIGVYQITYEAPGFAVLVRSGIDVRLDFTATINVQLVPASQQQTIMVTGDTPLVDTLNSYVQAGFNKTQLTDVPNGRDMWNIIGLTAGMTVSTLDVGGSAVGNQTAYTSFGYGGQNRVMIDGINTSEGQSGAGFYFDYGSFAEFTVGTAANDAAMPVPGNQINAVIRTGGNQFHGEMYQDYENPSFQGTNISHAQLLQGAGVGTRIDTYHDTNGNLGGPIKHDRVWFFVSLRSQVSSYGVVGFPVEKPGSQPFYAKDQNITYKLSGNINRNHRLSNYIQWNPILKPWRGASSTNYLDSVYYQKAVAWVGNVQYNGSITPKLFVNVLLGTWGYNFPQVPYAGPDGKLAIRQTELASGNIAGSYPEVRSDPRRYQFEPTGSYFLDNFLHANHQIKFGWITERETEDNEQYGPLGQAAFTYNSAPGSPDFTTPYQVTLYNDPLTEWSLTMHHGAYIQDQVKVSSRLTLNLGARWDYYRSFYLPEHLRSDCIYCGFFYGGQPLPNGYSIPATPYANGQIPGNSSVLRYPFLIAPRIGAAWDITGKGKTVLKLNWGYYYSYNSTTIVNAANGLQQTTYTFKWNDPANLPFDPSQLGAFVSNTGGTSSGVQPHIKAPRFDDMGIVLQHQLTNSLSIEGGFIFRELHHDWQRVDITRVNGLYSVPFVATVPGPNDGVNGDNTGLQQVTLYDIPKAQLTPSVLQYQTPPGNNNIYRNWELTVNKRLSNHFTAVGSFYWTKASYPNGGVATNPNTLINNGVSITNWTSHVTGTYELPWGFRISPVARMQSGTPLGRTYNVSGLNSGTVALQADPVGAYRSQDLFVFDTRLEKQFRIHERFRINADLDLFNILNSNADNAQSSTTGVKSVVVAGTKYQYPTFLSPTTILPPRVMRLGVRFMF
jgi:hypothetical protein